MQLLDRLRRRAREGSRRLLLLEGDDRLAHEAARRLREERLADPILLRSARETAGEPFPGSEIRVEGELEAQEVVERLVAEGEVDAVVAAASEAGRWQWRDAAMRSAETCATSGMLLMEGGTRCFVLATPFASGESSVESLARAASRAAFAAGTLLRGAPSVLFLADLNGSEEEDSETRGRLERAAELARSDAPGLDFLVPSERLDELLADEATARVLVFPSLQAARCSGGVMQALAGYRLRGLFLLGRETPWGLYAPANGLAEVVDLCVITAVLS